MLAISIYCIINKLHLINEPADTKVLSVAPGLGFTTESGRLREVFAS
jgi:hypothetical protein